MRLLEKPEITPVVLFLWPARAWLGALGLLSPGGLRGSPRGATRVCVSPREAVSVRRPSARPGTASVLRHDRPPAGWAVCASPSALPCRFCSAPAAHGAALCRCSLRVIDPCPSLSVLVRSAGRLQWSAWVSSQGRVGSSREKPLQPRRSSHSGV